MKNVLLFLSLLSIISCNSSNNKEKFTRLTRGSVQVYDEAAKDFVSENSRIELLVDSLFLAEGPLWVDKLNSLLFTQVAANKIYSWNSNSGFSLYMEPSGYTGIVPAESDGLLGSNGMVLDSNGDLILTQHGDRRVVRLKNWETNSPNFETLAGSYNDKLFNSPNDLVYADNGDLYFTDPPYGLKNGDKDALKELAFNGVFKLTPSGEISLIIDNLTRPNGVAISNDQKTLYVAVSDPKDRRIMAYDITQYGVENSRVFFNDDSIEKQSRGNFDGIKIHPSGTIFATGPGGVLIITPEGKHLGTIKTEEKTANCAFDSNYKYLYMTTHMYLTRIKL